MNLFKKSIVALFAVFALFVFFSGCAANQQAGDQTNKDIQASVLAATTPVPVDVAEAEKLISGGITVIDVRTPEEYASGHIENALNIDFKSSLFAEEIGKLDKNKSYLVHCKSGVRSGQAVQIMRELGFAQVYDLKGGITAWEAQGKEVVK